MTNTIYIPRSIQKDGLPKESGNYVFVFHFKLRAFMSIEKSIHYFDPSDSFCIKYAEEHYSHWLEPVDKEEFLKQELNKRNN